MDYNQITPQTQAIINFAVDSAIRRTLEQLSKSSPAESSIDEDYLSAEQAAAFLKIKLSTLYSKVGKGDLPHYRSGKRKLLFSKKELESYIAGHRHKTNQEISEEVDDYILKNRR
jgi:excisionase family DNA binding protein